MKVVVKMKVEDIAKFQQQGIKLKYVNLRTAYELYGDKVYEDCGTHMYVSLDANEDLLNQPTLAHL